MSEIYDNSYLPDILHDIAQGLLVPTMVFIVLMILMVVFLLGQFIVEYFTERRHFKVNTPAIVNSIQDASYGDIDAIVAKSSLLRFQKAALMTVDRNLGLPEEPLYALASLQINKAEKRLKKRMAWTDTISKVAPLLGLMGTLIPLGPGIIALGQNDITQLSQSLLLAFDATVCGLICAIVSLIISKVRSLWYGEYITSLESLMSCVVDKGMQAHREGICLPHGYKGDPLQEMRDADKAAAPARGRIRRSERPEAAAELVADTEGGE